jgi:signal transduction histidine kinase
MGDRWWAALATVLSAGAGVAIALVAIPGVRATTGVSHLTAVLEGVARGLFVAIPVAVGLYACRRPPHVRFGWLLVAFSGAWFISMLSSSASPTVYSVGRVGYWIEELGLACLLLTFPTGRLDARFDRIVVAATTAIVATLFLPTALLVSRYPVPVPVAGCDVGCPHNAFMVLGRQPAVMNAFVTPLRNVLVVCVFVVVAARLAWRIRAANKLVRRAITPVLAAASVRMVLYPAALFSRGLAPHGLVTHVFMWTLALLMPMIALGFLLGLARWRMFVTSAIQGVHARLRGIPGPQHVRDVLAEAFEDPGLQIGYWVRPRRCWVAADGRPVQEPAPGSGRYLTEVHGGSERVAILHDVALRDERAFLDTAASLATIAFASDQLSARAARTLREVSASRARIAAAADSERRRIERDLHEGAQQRVAALRIQLELAAERTQDENPEEALSLRALGASVDRAIEDMRAVALAIYPAVLSDRGLADALRSVALRSPIYTTVRVDGLSDHPEEIAATVYFCCLEALDNAARHADPTTIEIVLTEADSTLHFSVRDDGVGFTPSTTDRGAGIINMRDRLATIGGELKLHSDPGQGTRVSGRIPLPVIGDELRGGTQARSWEPMS